MFYALFVFRTRIVHFHHTVVIPNNKKHPVYVKYIDFDHAVFYSMIVKTQVNENVFGGIAYEDIIA